VYDYLIKKGPLNVMHLIGIADDHCLSILFECSACLSYVETAEIRMPIAF